MTYIPIPDPITPDWMTAVLRANDFLEQGSVLTVAHQATDSFNSQTLRLQLSYSADVPSELPTRMILKRNIEADWGIEAGAEEVKFYQLAASLTPRPPGIVPCCASAYDPTSGNSYLLLQDLSETHASPITRDQQVSIVEGVPAADMIERVVETLAKHHAYWWNHPLLRSDKFVVGYWSRNADRFEQYFQRRRTSWEKLRADEASWFPADLLDLYESVFAHLRHHWQTYLEPRFRTQTDLTLLHGDAYFANFLCPKPAMKGETYLIDWQSPVVDIGGYDLANLIAAFWTPEQRHEGQREPKMLWHYYTTFQAATEVIPYTWDNLMTDYKSGLIYWLLVPVQDYYGGSRKDYWWPKMQCILSAFREWKCGDLLGM